MLRGSWSGHYENSDNILIPQGFFYNSILCIIYLYLFYYILIGNNDIKYNCEEDIIYNTTDHVRWNTILFSIEELKGKDEKLLLSTEGIKSGTYYWEFEVISNNSGFIGIGIGNNQCNVNNYLGSDRYGWSFQCTHEVWHNGIHNSYSDSINIKSNDIIGVELNLIEGTLRYFINNVSCGIAFDHLNSDVIITSLGVLPAVSMLGDKDKIRLKGFANGEYKLYYEPTYNIKYYCGKYYNGMRHGYGMIETKNNSTLEGYFCYNCQIGLHKKILKDNNVCYFVIERNRIVKPATEKDIDYYNSINYIFIYYIINRVITTKFRII